MNSPPSCGTKFFVQTVLSNVCSFAQTESIIVWLPCTVLTTLPHITEGSILWCCRFWANSQFLKFPWFLTSVVVVSISLTFHTYKRLYDLPAHNTCTTCSALFAASAMSELIQVFVNHPQGEKWSNVKKNNIAFSILSLLRLTKLLNTNQSLNLRSSQFSVSPETCEGRRVKVFDRIANQQYAHRTQIYGSE